MANILALIPARSGSKAVRDKNIREIGGHSLLEWSIAACLRSSLIERIIVSTDSLQYASLAKSFGAEVPFLRPDEISGDRSTDYEFVDHALSWLEGNEQLPEYIVHIRPTTPFRDPALIDQAIVSFVDQADSTALRSVHEMSESAYKTFEINQVGKLSLLGVAGAKLDQANNARQQFPPTFHANGYVDVLSSRFIKAHGLIHGDSVMPFITPPVVEVDTEDDFAHLEFLFARNPQINRQLFA